MLDEKTLRVLEFLNEHPDKQFSIYQMNQRGIAVTFETMDWLHNREMVFRYEDEEMFSYAYEEPEYLIRSMPVDVRNCADSSTLKKLRNVRKTQKFAPKRQKFVQESALWCLSLQL